MLPFLLAQILGGALSGDAVLTWGQRLERWPLNGGQPQALARFAAGPPGCAAPDGTLFLLEGTRLVRRRPPYQNADLVEADTVFDSCLPVRLHGRPGVVIQHHYSQVRFYEEPRRRGRPWTYRDLYSIYTNSRQGGFLPYDLDRDGHLDLFMGNYFLRNPGRPAVDWRIFAVNAWHDTPEAARASLAWLPPDRLVWAEAAADSARVAVFQRPADLKQLWSATPVPGAYRRPRVATGPLDAGPKPELAIGDRTRIEVFWDGELSAPATIATGEPVLGLWIHQGKLIVLHPGGPAVHLPRR